jgi:hypothetical protein
VFTSTGYEHRFFFAGVFAVIASPVAPIITVELSFSFMMMRHTARSSFSQHRYDIVKFLLALPRDESDTLMYRLYRIPASSELMPTDHYDHYDHYDLRCRPIIKINDVDCIVNR